MGWVRVRRISLIPYNSSFQHRMQAIDIIPYNSSFQHRMQAIDLLKDIGTLEFNSLFYDLYFYSLVQGKWLFFMISFHTFRYSMRISLRNVDQIWLVGNNGCILLLRILKVKSPFNDSSHQFYANQSLRSCVARQKIPGTSSDLQRK